MLFFTVRDICVTCRDMGGSGAPSGIRRKPRTQCTRTGGIFVGNVVAVKTIEELLVGVLVDPTDGGR